MKFKDLKGQTFGLLTVIDRAENRIDSSGRSRTMWNCICKCGNKKVASSDYLKQNECPSCGCEALKNKIEKNRKNNIGEKYGRLTILDILWDTKPTRALCKCDCGNDFIGAKADIVIGHTQSCGCLKSEKTSESNTKDWTGFTAKSGVEFVKQHHRNNKGQWMWECT